MVVLVRRRGWTKQQIQGVGCGGAGCCDGGGDGGYGEGGDVKGFVEGEVVVRGLVY